MVDEPPKQIVARYRLRSPRWYSTTPRRVTEEDRQHPAGERIERPAMADALRRGQPADERDDVMRRRAGRLVTTRIPSRPGPER